MIVEDFFWLKNTQDVEEQIKETDYEIEKAKCKQEELFKIKKEMLIGITKIKNNLQVEIKNISLSYEKTKEKIEILFKEKEQIKIKIKNLCDDFIFLKEKQIKIFNAIDLRQKLKHFQEIFEELQRINVSDYLLVFPLLTLSKELSILFSEYIFFEKIHFLLQSHKIAREVIQRKANAFVMEKIKEKAEYKIVKNILSICNSQEVIRLYSEYVLSSCHFICDSKDITQLEQLFKWFLRISDYGGYLICFPKEWDVIERIKDDFSNIVKVFIEDCFSLKEPSPETIEEIVPLIKWFDKKGFIIQSCEKWYHILSYKIREESFSIIKEEDKKKIDNKVFSNAVSLFLFFEKNIRRYPFLFDNKEKNIFVFDAVSEYIKKISPEKIEDIEFFLFYLNTLDYIQTMLERIKNRLNMKEIFFSENSDLLFLRKKIISSFGSLIQRKLNTIIPNDWIYSYDQEKSLSEIRISSCLIFIVDMIKNLKNVLEKESDILFLIKEIATKLSHRVSFLFWTCKGIKKQGAEQLVLDMKNLCNVFEKEIKVEIKPFISILEQIEKSARLLMYSVNSVSLFMEIVLSLFPDIQESQLSKILKMKGVIKNNRKEFISFLRKKT